MLLVDWVFGYLPSQRVVMATIAAGFGKDLQVLVSATSSTFRFSVTMRSYSASAAYTPWRLLLPGSGAGSGLPSALLPATSNGQQNRSPSATVDASFSTSATPSVYHSPAAATILSPPPPPAAAADDPADVLTGSPSDPDAAAAAGPADVLTGSHPDAAADDDPANVLTGSPSDPDAAAVRTLPLGCPI